jgi:hypothetical protein
MSEARVLFTVDNFKHAVFFPVGTYSDAALTHLDRLLGYRGQIQLVGNHYIGVLENNDYTFKRKLPPNWSSLTCSDS